jgi:hypothetical protein
LLYPALAMHRSGFSSLALSMLLVAAAGCGAGGGDASSGATTSGSTSSDATSTAPTSSTTPTSDATSTGTDADTSTTQTEPAWEIAFEADESIGALFSVWGSSGEHVYAVGGQQGDAGFSQGAMLVRTAGAWTTAALPAETPKLNWIHGRDDLRVVVGERGAILMRDGDDEGAAWTTHGCATVLPLWGTWITAADDVWAVGGDGFDRPPVLCHYDGVAWSNVELPALSIDAKALFKVFGAAADDVWAVGDQGLLLHWDGEAWSQVTVDTVADLISLWGPSPDDLLAVGGRANGVLARKDAAGWSIAALAELPGLNGVWLDPAGTAHIVGIQGTIATVAPGSTTPEIVDSPTILTLHAVWSPGDGSFIAVGGSLEMPPPLVGIIVEKN